MDVRVFAPAASAIGSAPVPAVFASSASAYVVGKTIVTHLAGPDPALHELHGARDLVGDALLFGAAITLVAAGVRIFGQRQRTFLL